MLRGNRPEMLQLLANLCAGSDVPAWVEETAQKQAAAWVGDALVCLRLLWEPGIPAT